MTPQELLKLAEDACDHTPWESGDPSKTRGLCCAAVEAAEIWERTLAREIRLTGHCARLLEEFKRREKYPSYQFPILEADWDEETKAIVEDARKWREMEKEKFKEAYVEASKVGWNGITQGQLDGSRDRASKAEKERDCYREALVNIVKEWDKWETPSEHQGTASNMEDIAKEALAGEKP